jgi:hypothetical protein
MDRNQVAEFYRELDATDESFVRQKYRDGGYPVSKAKHVKAWIEGKDAEKAEKHNTSTRRWTIVSGVCALIAVIIGLIPLVHH